MRTSTIVVKLTHLACYELPVELFSVRLSAVDRYAKFYLATQSSLLGINESLTMISASIDLLTQKNSPSGAIPRVACGTASKTASKRSCSLKHHSSSCTTHRKSELPEPALFWKNSERLMTFICWKLAGVLRGLFRTGIDGQIDRA